MIKWEELTDEQGYDLFEAVTGMSTFRQSPKSIQRGQGLIRIECCFMNPFTNYVVEVSSETQVYAYKEGDNDTDIALLIDVNAITEFMDTLVRGEND